MWQINKEIDKQRETGGSLKGKVKLNYHNYSAIAWSAWRFPSVREQETANNDEAYLNKVLYLN